MSEKEVAELKKRLQRLQKEQGDGQPSGELVEALNSLGSSLFATSPDEAERYALMAREAAGKIGDRAGEARSFQVEGFSHWSRGSFDRSEDCYRRALDAYRHTGDRKGMADAMNNLGAALGVRCRLDLAIDSYTKSMQIYEEIGYEHGVGSTSANIGNLYRRMERYEPALEYQSKALGIFRSLGDRQYEATVLGNIGSILMGQDRPGEALERFREALRLYERQGNRKGAAYCLRYLGSAFRKLGDTDSAIECCRQALEAAEEIENRRGMLLAYKTLGSSHMDAGQHERSRECLQRALELAQQIGVRDSAYEICHALSRVYEREGRYRRALEYYKRYSDLQGEIRTRELTEKIAVMEIEHEVEKKEKEAEIHRLRNVELCREIEERKKAQKSLRESESRFRSLSIEDPLSGCFNRRYFFDIASRIIRRAAEDDDSISLVLLDLDHFKKVNDSYGHQAGDNVLKEFVDLATSLIRPEDVFARYGGEEFTLLMPDTDPQEARATAERIRSRTESHVFGEGEEELELTVSAGVCHTGETGEGEPTLDGLVRIADSRLYRAKSEGRNRIL